MRLHNVITERQRKMQAQHSGAMKKKTNTTYLNNQHIIRDIATCLLYVGIRCGCIETKAIYNARHICVGRRFE